MLGRVGAVRRMYVGSWNVPNSTNCADSMQAVMRKMIVVAVAVELVLYFQIYIDSLSHGHSSPAFDEIFSHTFDNCMAYHPCECSNEP